MGTMTFGSACTYEGSVVCGVLEGRGMMTFHPTSKSASENSSSDDDHADDDDDDSNPRVKSRGNDAKANSWGESRSSVGGRYRGEFRAGRRHGQGSLVSDEVLWQMFP